MNNRFIISYAPGNTFIHKLNGLTKTLIFITMTVYIIMTFDVRVMLPMLLLCIAGVISMKPNWKPILFMLGFLTVTAGIIGSTMLFLVASDSALTYVGSHETLLVRFSDSLYLTKELLWYAGAMFFKRLCSFAVAIFFVLSITPSEIAAGFNRIGLPYKVCNIISLAFRTIPDVARDFTDIKNSLQMRGVELDGKRVSLGKKIKQYVLLLVPLIITSFGKVDNIANSMDLRGFGKHKKRTWYSEHPPAKADWVVRGCIIAVVCVIIFYIVYC
ncbi:MAG: energy-coupling factor transporter transmembrane component T, partial [Eubacteriales bacterium]|nr:energy-coupling factor transporter transmembrane component T [Eubacteriales bacterium]